MSKRTRKAVLYVAVVGCVLGCVFGCMWRWGKVYDAGEAGKEQKSMKEETGDAAEEVSCLEERRRSMEGDRRMDDAQGDLQETGNLDYQEYFQVTQGELAETKGIDNLTDCETFGYLNNPFRGIVFSQDDGIELQYGNGTTSPIEESALPRAVIVHGAESGLGYRDARAGMNFEQIKQKAGEAELCKGFMYFENEPVYYLQYRNDLYVYSFLSDHEDGEDSYLIVTQTAAEIPQVGWTIEGSKPKETVWSHWMAACDFEQIEKEHEILEYDIGSSPQYDYENTPLREYVEEQKEEDRHLVEEFGSGYEMQVDYHLFDFNDDGIEDYLLCIDGILYSGTGGHMVELFIGKEDETVEKVLDISLRFHDESAASGHDRFTVLDEKTDGYYAIVLPGTNRILRYDAVKNGYAFQETE